MGICLLWCVYKLEFNFFLKFMVALWRAKTWVFVCCGVYCIYNANVHFLIFILYFCQIMSKIVNLLHFPMTFSF